MLRFLQIENIAVIEHAKISFEKGFHALTGETGAGKSIIIDSLYAVLGERTSRELIRRGCKQATVTACFTEVPTAILQRLQECGIAAEENEELILQRVISEDGPSKVRINMQPANVGLLKEIGKYLINIHGQFDNQNLLNPLRHIDFVDSYAKNLPLLQTYREKFEALRTIHKELNQILEQEETQRKRYELLQYQVEELSAAALKPGELLQLREYLKRQQDCERICENLRAAVIGISGQAEQELNGAKDLLYAAVKKLEEVLPQAKELQPVCEHLAGMAYDLEDVEACLADKIEESSYDPGGVERATERLELVRELTEKYGGSEEAALSYLETAAQELKVIHQSSERQQALTEQLEQAEAELVKAGKALTLSRKKALDAICEKISQELKYLDFRNAEFTANFSQGRYTKNGCDTLEFLICANLGETAKPLSKVASGGELSRVMLAIRSVLSEADDVGTLVFDEIDTGISGHAALRVAQKLRAVSKNRQVICVTHLAQLAAAANFHLYIEKSEKNGRTFTVVTPIEEKNRKVEIARMMSGDSSSATILASADELLNYFKNS